MPQGGALETEAEGGGRSQVRDQQGQGILEKEACCALRHTRLPSEELLCLK